MADGITRGNGWRAGMKTVIRTIDLFCGLGGFRLAAQGAAREGGSVAQCLFSCDIDAACRTAYEANFGERPQGDIAAVAAERVPDHDLLLAGFPCQPFSIIGRRQGFEDTRGTLFFDIARILEAKRPQAVLLENVKMLKGHNGGKTLERIMETLRELGYLCDFRVLNALDFGLPQKRERIFIAGTRRAGPFEWPQGSGAMKPLAAILERDVPASFYASARIRRRRRARHAPAAEPTIWHENKSGHIGVYPYSCALRAGASYNYLLVNGERRLTPREMLRLQGFPDSYRIACSDSQTRKQAGNSLPVPVAQAVLRRLFAAQGWTRLRADAAAGNRPVPQA
jgi:DNA (cytosine-5)-methyltransferase 1